MKILSIMCDMVRPSVLKFGNSLSGFEATISGIGGVYYSNCFSPGPDTGRSLGCYWSGKNPKDNGCNTRAKYPKFYLNQESFLDVLKEKNYSLNFFTNPNEKVLGDLPSGYENIGIHNDDLDLVKFLNKIDFDVENSYTHIFLTDFHWALDDYGANGEGVEVGLKLLNECIQKIFSLIDINIFDYIIIFSDHGFKYDLEFYSQKKYLLVNRDRSNTMMFVHRKGDNFFETNDKLCSIIDVYPTIMDIVGEKNKGYGYSLFSKEEHDYILVEDHADFRPCVNQNIEFWGMIKKDVIYIRTYEGYFRDDGKAFELDYDEFDKFLCCESDSFREAYKQLNILKLYSVMANDKSTYSNGEKRYRVESQDIIKRIHRKMVRNTTRETYTGKYHESQK